MRLIKNLPYKVSILAGAIFLLSTTTPTFAEQEAFARPKPKTDRTLSMAELTRLQELSKQFLALQSKKPVASQKKNVLTAKSRQESVLAEQASRLQLDLQKAANEQLQQLQQVSAHIEKHHLSDVIRQRQINTQNLLSQRHQQLQTLLTQLETANHQQQAAQRQAIFSQINQQLTTWNGESSQATTSPKAVNKPKVRQPIKSRVEYLRNLSILGVPDIQVAGALPSDMVWPVLPQLSETPQTADTAANEDVQITPAIQAKAAALNHNPAQIYKWVYDNIRYIPSYGSLQGAEQTLQSQQGNAFDTASLLIALLRASNIPARYVYGTIEIPSEQAIPWLNVADIDSVLSAFAQGGVPSTAVTTAGKTTAIQMEHVWVEAYVDFVPSRGIVNKTPDTWIPLDASYKRTQHYTGIDGQHIAPLDTQALLNEIQKGATLTEQGCSAQGLHPEKATIELANFEQKLTTYLNQQPDSTLRDVIGGDSIQAYPSRGLSNSLPYKITVAAADFQTLPDSMRHYFVVKLYQNTDEKQQDNPAFNVKISSPRLAGHQLTLGFVPSTPADQELLASYLPTPHADGSPYQWQELVNELPGYLLHLTPVLRLDGLELKRMGEFMLGQPLDTRMGFISPNNNALPLVSESIRAGDYQAIVTNVQGYTQTILQQQQNKLSSAQAALNSTNSSTMDTALGSVLATGLYSYWAVNDAEEQMAANIEQLSVWRSPSFGRLGATWSTNLQYGLPLVVKPQGLQLAIEQMSRQIVSQHGNSQSLNQFSRSQRVRELWYQGQILEYLFSSTNQVATASNALTRAIESQQQGQILRTLTSDNTARLLPELTDLTTASQNALQQGLVGGNSIIVPPLLDQTTQPLVLTDERLNSRYTGLDTNNTQLQAQTLLRPSVYGWLSLLPAQQSSTLMTTALNGLPQQSQAISEVLLYDGGVRLQNSQQQRRLASRLFVAQLPLTAEQSCQQTATVLAQVHILSTNPLLSSSQNHSPEITSTPIYSSAVASRYQYTIVASDADHDPLSYRVVTAPTGMQISPQGVLTWDTPVSGSYPVTIRVDDGKAYREQSWTLKIGATADPIEINLAIQPSMVSAGDNLTISLWGQGGTGALTRTLTIDGQPVTLDSSGNAQLIASNTVGNHTIVATISDGQRTVTRQSIYTVKNPTDTAAPIAEITTPTNDSEVTSLIHIQGTANDEQLAFYRLMLRPSGASDSSWQEIAVGYQPIVQGELGTLDPSTRANGQYDLGLFVTDSQGRVSSVVTPFEISRELKIGQFALSFNDVAYEVGGIPLQVTRSYDTRRKDEKLSFGYGWSESSQSVNIRKNMRIGLDWKVVKNGLSLCLYATGKRKVSVSLPDGQIERFEVNVETPCTIGLPAPTLLFSPINTTSRLEAIGVGTPYIQGGALYDLDNNDIWNPHQFKLTRADGTVFYLDEDAGIRQVVDRWGNTVTFGTNGIEHSNGQVIHFIRDSQNRITQVTDQDNKSLHYNYDDKGDLISVIDRLGQKTSFSYNKAHALVSYTDARGIKVAAMNYDEQGRLTQVADSLGRATQLSHDLDNHFETVKDRNGNSTSYRYDDAGNILETTDALGHKTTYTYDANGNELTVTDALGHTTTKTYGTTPIGAEGGSYNQVLTEKNPLGQTTAYSYETPSGEIKTTTDAKGNTTQFIYYGNGSVAIGEPLNRSSLMRLDSKGNLMDLIVAGNTTHYTYNAQGKPLTETSPTGVVTHFSYDAQGNESERHFSRTDNTGTASPTMTTLSTKKEYDANGQVLAEVNEIGQRRSFVYNAANKVVKETDQSGRSTLYDYDSELHLVKTTYPDGTSDSSTFDANGNEISKTDTVGRVTQMAYDGLNRLIKTRYPNGNYSETIYDAIGRAISERTALGEVSRTEYDAAGRVSLRADGLGHSMSYVYDANGNMTSMTDAQQQSTHYDYDALNRLIKTTLPDGKTKITEWRVDGLKGAEIDEQGRRVDYRYDGQGRLIEVLTTDPVNP